MPPTNAMGAITKNRRVLPTATPLSTSWYSGMVRFGRARERRHRLIGCIFWAKFARGGGLIPWPNRDGQAYLDRLDVSQFSVQYNTYFGRARLRSDAKRVQGQTT